jgi:NDP-mannose synthase
MVAISDTHVVLQAGGRGSRLRPLTDETPKPLLPVAGVSMLERLVRQLTAVGARRLTVVTGYKSEMVRRHVESFTGTSALNIDFVHEDAPMGNVGALAVVRPHGPVVFAFADLITDLSFEELLHVHTGRKAAVTLASHYESHRLQLGELVVDGDSVTGYLEKPEKNFLICSGIAVFEPAVIDLLPPDRPSGLVDLVVLAIAAQYPVTHWLHGAYWRDVNTPEAFREAQASVRPNLP